MARRPMTVSASAVVAAPPEQVWAAVSDPTQMGRWSPENTGATVTGGPLVVGSTFEGRNRRGGASWVTRCTVTASDPGERFAFRVGAIGVRSPRVPAAIASWEYRFEAVPGGTRVTETWTDDRRWPDPVAAVLDRVLTRGKPFAEHSRRGIEATLRGLQRELGTP